VSAARYVELTHLPDLSERDPGTRYGPLPSGADETRLYRDGSPATHVIVRVESDQAGAPIETDVYLHEIHGPANSYINAAGTPVVEYDITENGVVEFAVSQCAFSTWPRPVHRIFCRVDAEKTLDEKLARVGREMTTTVNELIARLVDSTLRREGILR
jgi:hypothetical protein